MQFPTILLAVSGSLISTIAALPTTSQPKHHAPGQWDHLVSSNIPNYNATAIYNTTHTHGPIPAFPRPVHNPTALAARDDLWTMTLCDAPFHGGQCTDVPMMNNQCEGTPILNQAVSVYLPDQTACQVYNNPICHLGSVGELGVYVAKSNDDLRGLQRANNVDFPWWSWVCQNSA